MWCESECAETENALRTSADIVDQSNSLFIQFFLVKQLVLNEVHVDKVSQVGTGIPPDIVGINVDFSQVSDHLGLVCSVGFRTGSRGGAIEVLLLLIGGFRWEIDDREIETVCDFERAVHVHADKAASGGGRETGGAVLDDFHNHLSSR